MTVQRLLELYSRKKRNEKNLMNNQSNYVPYFTLKLDMSAVASGFMSHCHEEEYKLVMGQ